MSDRYTVRSARNRARGFYRPSQSARQQDWREYCKRETARLEQEKKGGVNDIDRN